MILHPSYLIFFWSPAGSNIGLGCSIFLTSYGARSERVGLEDLWARAADNKTACSESEPKLIHPI